MDVAKDVVVLKGLQRRSKAEYHRLSPIQLRDAVEEMVQEIEKACIPRTKMSKEEWRAMWRKILVEYGSWSMEFNEALLARKSSALAPIGLSTKVRDELNWVYAYWWNRMHWIENVLISKSRLGGIPYQKALENGRLTLNGLLEGRINISQTGEKFQRLINHISGLSAEEGIEALQKKGEKK